MNDMRNTAKESGWACAEKKMVTEKERLMERDIDEREQDKVKGRNRWRE